MTFISRIAWWFRFGSCWPFLRLLVGNCRTFPPLTLLLLLSSLQSSTSIWVSTTEADSTGPCCLRTDLSATVASLEGWQPTSASLSFSSFLTPFWPSSPVSSFQPASSLLPWSGPSSWTVQASTHCSSCLACRCLLLTPRKKKLLQHSSWKMKKSC